MSVFDHLDEARERAILSFVAIGLAIAVCFSWSKELIIVLEAPVAEQGVKFLQLSPGEFFFTSFKASGGSAEFVMRVCVATDDVLVVQFIHAGW